MALRRVHQRNRKPRKVNMENDNRKPEGVITSPPATCSAARPAWEYLCGGMEYCWPDDEQKKLNALGKDGWELVACIRLPNETRFYMKRQNKPS